MKRDPDIIDAWPNLDFTGAWADRGPSPAGNSGPYLKVPGGDDSAHRIYSRFQPGDHLWVRETFALVWPGESPPDNVRDNRIEYRADSGNKCPGQWPEECGDDPDCPRWKPSIHMPRWASRLTLRVTSVRVERLQDISEEDARAEGVQAFNEQYASVSPEQPFRFRCADRSDRFVPAGDIPYTASFIVLWDTLNSDRGFGWDVNPWVWVISFERVNP
jgi:hypothetical protein